MVGYCWKWIGPNNPSKEDHAGRRYNTQYTGIASHQLQIDPVHDNILSDYSTSVLTHIGVDSALRIKQRVMGTT